jgi:cellulose synthase/poly-beta-1,6-N-acetylglucosamine synthase-like glycosyltransferase
MQSDDMRLLMTIDADTRVEEKSITHMVYAMNQQDNILALCGETKVDNKWQSWVTMIQVFEYYNNHHMKKVSPLDQRCYFCMCISETTLIISPRHLSLHLVASHAYLDASQCTVF